MIARMKEGQQMMMREEKSEGRRDGDKWAKNAADAAFQLTMLAVSAFCMCKVFGIDL